MTQQTVNRSIGIGVIFIVLGAIFLLENLNILPYAFFDYFFNWKGILIGIGAIILAKGDNRNTGVVLISIGGFFILSDVLYYELGLRWFDAWNIFWPLVFIVIGILLVTGRKHLFSSRHDSKKKFSDIDQKDMLNVSAILGGGEIKVHSKNFKGGKVTAIMGGGSYDMTNAELAEGSHEIDVFCLFGGAEFIVPSGWNVRIEMNSLFGGFTDNRKVAPENPDPDRELVIRGTVLFGGGELKSYV